MKKQVTDCTTGQTQIIDFTEEETAAHEAASEKAAAEALKEQAKAALEKTDLVALRCLKAGAEFPAEWQEYVRALRLIAATAKGEFPAQPAYPAGT